VLWASLSIYEVAEKPPRQQKDGETKVVPPPGCRSKYQIIQGLLKDDLQDWKLLQGQTWVKKLIIMAVATIARSALTDSLAELVLP
jgi:hypothetical protein